MGAGVIEVAAGAGAEVVTGASLLPEQPVERKMVTATHATGTKCLRILTINIINNILLLSMFSLQQTPGANASFRRRHRDTGMGWVLHRDGRGSVRVRADAGVHSEQGADVAEQYAHRVVFEGTQLRSGAAS